MPVSPDLAFQQLSTVQNKLTQAPITVVAATTIAPTTFLTLITGTTAVTTITPPIDGQHMLAIQASATNFSGFTTTGNIAAASTTNGAWANKLALFVYNPNVNKYYPLYPVAYA